MASEADLKMELSISQMLRAGVSLAAVVVFVGGTLFLLQAHGAEPDYRHFHGISIPAREFAPVFHGVLQLDSRSIMRLAFCVYSFAAQKDKIYVVVSTIVLTVLLYSFFRP